MLWALWIALDRAPTSWIPPYSDPREPGCEDIIMGWERSHELRRELLGPEAAVLVKAYHAYTYLPNRPVGSRVNFPRHSEAADYYTATQDEMQLFDQRRARLQELAQRAVQTPVQARLTPERLRQIITQQVYVRSRQNAAESAANINNNESASTTNAESAANINNNNNVATTANNAGSATTSNNNNNANNAGSAARVLGQRDIEDKTNARRQILDSIHKFYDSDLFFYTGNNSRDVWDDVFSLLLWQEKCDLPSSSFEDESDFEDNEPLAERLKRVLLEHARSAAAASSQIQLDPSASSSSSTTSESGSEFATCFRDFEDEFANLQPFLMFLGASMGMSLIANMCYLNGSLGEYAQETMRACESQRAPSEKRTDPGDDDLSQSCKKRKMEQD